MSELRRDLSRAAIAIAALLVGLVGGAWVLNERHTPSLVALIWFALAAALSVAWGLRLALLLVIPLTCAFVGGLLPNGPLDPAFYGAAAQVAPVLLIVLGLEQRAGWTRVQGRFEALLLIVLVGYVAIAVAFSLYGAAVCDSNDASACSTRLFDVHILGDVTFGATAATLCAGGLAGGLAGAICLAILRIREESPGSEGPSEQRPEPEPSRAGNALTTAAVVLLVAGLARDRRSRGGS